MPSPKLNMLGTTITARFVADVERLGQDMLNQTLQVWDFGNFQITQELVNDAFDDGQYRLDLAGDSATWQAYQLGRAEQIDESGMRYAWILDAGAAHCPTCLDFAAMSPFTVDELPGIPGEADTECNGSCRCNLEPVK